MTMKPARFCSIFLSAALLLNLFAGCGEQPQAGSPSPEVSPSEEVTAPFSTASEEPSASEELAEVPAFGLNDLLFRLLIEGGGCPDWPNTKSKGWDDSAGRWFADDTAALFGVDPSQYERTAAAYWDPEHDDGVSYTEAPYSITLFQTDGEEQAKDLIPTIKEHQKNAQVAQVGRYVAVFLCDNPAQLSILLPRYANSADTAGYYLRCEEGNAQPILEDPNYPDRERFNPPNKEDMSIYDTSEILAAWEAKDPSGMAGYDREIYDAAQAVIDAIITDGMSDFEKENAVYNWLVNSVNYDWTHQDIMVETSRDSYGPYGGLVNHSAVCLGYAATFQLLMDMTGVECVTVVGAVLHNTGDHAWNLVRLDGNWYGVDSAWDASGRELAEDYEWQYFNMTDQELIEMRQWDYDSVPKAATEEYVG